MDIDILLGKRLKVLRESAGYSQAEVSECLGLSRGAYGHYETGAACPSLASLLQLARLYGFRSLDGLLGEQITGEGYDEVHTDLESKYYSSSLDRRRIVDFILNLQK